jgi:hypothetical protein
VATWAKAAVVTATRLNEAICQILDETLFAVLPASFALSPMIGWP